MTADSSRLWAAWAWPLASLAAAQEAPQSRRPSIPRSWSAPRRANRSPGAALDTRTEEVGGLLRCPVCQGLSVAASPSTMASNMKAEVRGLLASGYTEEQVLAYFERSYGEFVRLQPPLRGVNWLVWLGPLAGLLAGGATVFLALRRSRGGSSGRTPAEASLPPATRFPTTRPWPRRCSAYANVPTAGRAACRPGPIRDERRGRASTGPRPFSSWPRAWCWARSSSGRCSAVPGPPPKGGGAAPDDAALERRDLEGKCEALVAQLRELEDTASKRTEEQLARERYALELEAARRCSPWKRKGLDRCPRGGHAFAGRARRRSRPLARAPRARSSGASSGAPSAPALSASCSSSSTRRRARARPVAPSPASRAARA